MKVECSQYQVGLTLRRLCIACLVALAFPFTTFAQQPDTTDAAADTLGPYVPSTRPTFTPSDRYGDPFSSPGYETPFFLMDRIDGIVPPDAFTLASGDEVAIAIDGIGTLTNAVE